MRPETTHTPTCRAKPTVGVMITFHVVGELAAPPRGVCLWPRRVLGTRVPEAAVDEHSKTVTGEDKIGTTTYAGDRGDVDAVAQAHPVNE